MTFARDQLVGFQRDAFRNHVLSALDEAAKHATKDPDAMGALDADLPELFRVIDRLFDRAVDRSKPEH